MAGANYGLLNNNLPQMTPYPMATGVLGGIEQLRKQQDTDINQQQANAYQQQVNQTGQFQQAQIDKLKNEVSMEQLKAIPLIFGNVSDAPSYQQAMMIAKQRGLDTSDMPTTWGDEAQAFTQRATAMAKVASDQNTTSDMKNAAAMGMTLPQYYKYQSDQKQSDYKEQKSVYTDSKIDEKTLVSKAEAAENARNLTFKLDTLEKLDEAVNTGKFAEAKLLAQQIGGALGNKDLAFEAGNAEALKAMSRQAQMEIQLLLKGSTSNRDMVSIQEGSPELLKSEGGNAQVRASMKAAAVRSTMEYQFTRAYRDKYGTTSGAEIAYDKMLAENPLLIHNEQGILQFNPDSTKLTDKFGKYLVKPDFSSSENNPSQQTSSLPSSYTGTDQKGNPIEITPEQIKARATKEGISEEQLISRYGLKKKALKTPREVILQ